MVSKSLILVQRQRVARKAEVNSRFNERVEPSEEGHDKYVNYDDHHSEKAGDWPN